MPTSSSLLDTNVLVYSYDTQNPHHEACRRLREQGQSGGVKLCLAPQVLFEFFAVVTNPSRVVRPRPTAEALEEMEKLASAFHLISPPPDIHARVITLLRQVGFGSRHIYDAVLAATMLANGVEGIYTYDADRFSKIPGISVLSP